MHRQQDEFPGVYTRQVSTQHRHALLSTRRLQVQTELAETAILVGLKWAVTSTECSQQFFPQSPQTRMGTGALQQVDDKYTVVHGPWGPVFGNTRRGKWAHAHSALRGSSGPPQR